MASHSRMADDLVSRISELRTVAMSLCRNADQSDDLVQDTLLNAWAHLDHFKEGTNLGAWLATILRNRFLNNYRKQRLRCEIISAGQVEGVATVPNQDGWTISTDLRSALAQLPVRQRQAVLLVGADGLSLADAADVCKCEIGTIKSRLSRARDRLASLLSDEAAAGACRTHRRAGRKPLTRPESDLPRPARPGRPRRSLVASAAQN